MLRTFIQIMGLGMALLSSFFLIRGSISLTAKNIADLSGTYWNFNEALAKSLASQKADTLVGFILLLGSIIFQMVNLIWPMRWDDFAVSKKGIVIASIIIFALLIVSFLISNVYSKNLMSRVSNIHASRGSGDSSP